MAQHDLRLCGGCGKVRDERGVVSLAHAQACWIDLQTYMVTYGLTWDDVAFSPAYCPECASFLKQAAGRTPMSKVGSLP